MNKNNDELDAAYNNVIVELYADEHTKEIIKNSINEEDAKEIYANGVRGGFSAAVVGVATIGSIIFVVNGANKILKKIRA